MEAQQKPAAGVAQRVVDALLRLVRQPWSLGKALKLYAVFAALHTTFKVVLNKVRISRKMRYLRHLPGKDIDYAATELVANISRLHDWRCETMQKHRGVPLVRTADPHVEVICNTPESVETILKTEFNHVTKPSSDSDYSFKLLGEFLGAEGIFVLRHGAEAPEENNIWYDQRKTASKIFTKSNFNKLMYDTLLQKCGELVNVVEAAANANRGVTTNDRTKGASAVDMQEKFFCFTFDSIQKIFFNRDVDSVGGTEDDYATQFDQAHRRMLLHMFSVLPLFILTTHLLPFPFGALRPGADSINPLLSAYKWFVCPHYPKFREHIRKLDNYTYAVVKETRERRGDLLERRDLLAFFLQSKSDYTDKQLHDVILNFIIAGRDTTACTLTWLFYELALHPEVQDRIAEEVRSVIGKDGIPSIEDLATMPLLNGAMLEALRLHPPVPEDAKETMAPITFPDGTTVPAGVKVTFTPYTMGRDPERYPEPLEFRPERWIDRAEPSMFENPVFQAGPRFCLGKDLAKNETRLVTARLLQRFSFALEANESPDKITYALMVTMALKNDPAKGTHNLWLVPQHRD